MKNRGSGFFFASAILCFILGGIIILLGITFSVLGEVELEDIDGGLFMFPMVAVGVPLIIAGLIPLIAGIFYVKYSKYTDEQAVQHSGGILAWSIITLLMSAFLPGILALVGWSMLPRNGNHY